MFWLCATTFLLAAGWLAALALRGRSAAERHVVWLFVFAGLLALPIAREATRSWPVLEPVARTAREVIYVTDSAPLPAPPAWVIRWNDAVFGSWLAGVLVLLTRRGAAHLRANRLVASARVVTPSEPGVRVSSEIGVPLVCGLLDPVILLPESSAHWPAAQRESVLAHERMHIQRRDNLWQAMTHLACALYWPQPLTWLAVRAMRQECERACDDGVLAGGTPASAYADSLVNIARGLAQHGAAPAGGLAMTRTTQLHRRIAALLDPRANRQPVRPVFASTAATLALAAVFLVNGVFAQQSRLSGVVQDPSGGNIPRARIDLRTPGTDSVREVIYTNDAGEFSLDNVPDGTYDMTVAAPGFALLTQSNLVFENGKTKPFKITLNLGKVRERVTVAAQGGALAAPTGDGLAPKRIRIGGNVQSAKLVQRVLPVYPVTAKQDRVQGTVLLKAVIGQDGSVLNLEVLNRAVDARLVESALNAVRQWRYSSTLLNGAPVEVVTEVEVNFTLAP